ncbi:Glyoxalase/Bleomycin resistance protein/Dihydroxybiphenyl dioxygenase [Podospora fimiseda]|uniref:Glyoxalase/Bleomycin resistance protein/Dihydroxybiphenyl dioxygenase n=1 Tax=Podospora fimiseda TaxID=252190 RepID=A0AAN7BK92_9PEZI|nr:Glyoxalase/Bleomycin resistance protein/Dihydroxybiphenyl dioxygenase [Podospora fimiseda]
MPRQSDLKNHTSKFSTKSPDHDAARQRENQRRHRARVKSRMVELEDALSSTQRELDKALKQIENLTTEVERLNSLIQTSSNPLQDTSSPAPASSSTECHASCPPAVDDPDNDGPFLPPPLPGESTISCREAYSIIKNRIAHSDIDNATINEWLKQGFRRASVPGSGCQVQTHLLRKISSRMVATFSFISVVLSLISAVFFLISMAATLLRIMSHHNHLSHISLPIRSLPHSRQFYSTVLEPLGLSLVYDSTVSNPNKTPRILGYGHDSEHELLNLFEYSDYDNSAAKPGPGFHVAFNAPSREAVKEFHRKALENGGKDRGEPGLREGYGRNYFAAFVEDVDGWRLEIVCRVVEGEE